MQSVVLDTFYTYTYIQQQRVWLYYTYASLYNCMPFVNVYLVSYICLGWQLCSSSGLWSACDADQQRTKRVSHKVCLHVSTGEFRTSKRITANSTKRFQHPLFIRASDRVRLFYLSAKTTGITRSTNFSREYDVPGQESTGFLLLFIRWELETFHRVSW